MSSKYLVVLPTYNEKESLELTVQEIRANTKDVDILIVDDNSPDGTGAIADRLAKDSGSISVLHRTQKQGLGPAYLAGFDHGFSKGYEFIIEMDADGSHRPVDLAKLISASNSADLVIGSRWASGGAVLNWPWHRQLISRVGNTYARLLLGSSINDMTAGFRVYRSSLLKSIITSDIASHGYSFQVELAWRAEKHGAKIIEVPITFVERAHGNSKMSSAIVREALWLITKWGFRRLLP